jgi:hypothetical protein
MSKRGEKPRTKSAFAALWGFIAWLTGVLVSIAVGFGMVSGSLKIPLLPEIVTETAGWIVVILTILSATLAIIDKFAK